MAFKKAVEMVEIWNKGLTGGEVLEGKFEKTEKFNSKFGETTKYVISLSSGEKKGVIATASLISQFNNVPEGSLVRITYKGKETTKNGNPVNVYEVEYDDENIN